MSKLQLKIKDHDNNFIVLNNIRNLRFTLRNNREEVKDISSFGWRKVLDCAGSRHITIKINGILDSVLADELLRNSAMLNSNNDYEISFNAKEKIRLRCSVELYERYNDDKRERSLENENQQNQEEQHKEEDKQYIIQYIQDYLKVFEDILNQIDEGIDNSDSYERTMQIKRSIDRLIETLYSQAASEDIDAEFETTKHTRDKSESMKRVREKRRKQVIEEVLSSMFAQQQKELMNAKHLSHGHETAKDGDVHEAKEKVKSSIRGVLFSVIAHRMDPRRRAGETADGNEKQAHIYGREAVGGALGALLKTFLTAVIAVVREIAKPLQKPETSFAKQVEESRNADSQKGRSV